MRTQTFYWKAIEASYIAALNYLTKEVRNKKLILWSQISEPIKDTNSSLKVLSKDNRVRAFKSMIVQEDLMYDVSCSGKAIKEKYHEELTLSMIITGMP